MKAVDGVRSFCLEEWCDWKYQLKCDHAYYYQCELQVFVTARSLCDFVAWTKKKLHIECVILDEALLESDTPAKGHQ